MTSLALSIDAIAIGYTPGAPALSNVRIEVARGECVAVLGGNGAGKTALLRWIAGVLPRAGGRRVVNGRSIESARDAVQAGVGLVVQDPEDQLLGGTVRDDVELGPRNLGLDDVKVCARAEEAIAEVGLGAIASRPIESLSFGEKKRASLAGVLAMKPAVLLLDEPTAGLDPLGEMAFGATLGALVKAGTTLVVATHAVDLVPRFATRVVVLGDRRVLADGPCHDVLAKTEVLTRAGVRRPWPVELWANARELRDRAALPTLTLEEVLRCLTPLSS
jgi:cobalt/nickel transport system ATP-binding protein